MITKNYNPIILVIFVKFKIYNIFFILNYYCINFFAKLCFFPENEYCEWKRTKTMESFVKENVLKFCKKNCQHFCETRNAKAPNKQIFFYERNAEKAKFSEKKYIFT